MPDAGTHGTPWGSTAPARRFTRRSAARDVIEAVEVVLRVCRCIDVHDEADVIDVNRARYIVRGEDNEVLRRT